MSRSIRVVTGLALMAVAAQLAAASAQTQTGNAATPAQTRTSAPTGNAANGKTLYYDYACYACHGYTGETGARAFVGNRSPVLADEVTFTRFLRGRATSAPEVPSTSMPSYSARSLSDRQAKDIYAYIRTFTSHAPPLDQIEVMMQILKAAERRK